MNWDDVLDRMRDAGLDPVEENYTEHYGQILAAQRPEFQDRIIRCTYGKIYCAGLDLEIFLFPSQTQLQDFIELTGNDPRLIVRENAVLHFPVCDPAVIEKIVEAISS